MTSEYYSYDKNKIVKMLDIIEMKNMSIDDIVTLYKQGYIIESMQYPTYCSGAVSIDKQNIEITAGYDMGIAVTDAIAQKFVPTSKCLKSIVLNMKWQIFANDVYVEIRKNSGGLPLGDPQSTGYIARYIIPSNQVPSSFTDVTIPLDVLLDDSDLTNGIWIIVTLYVYDPSSLDNNIYVLFNGGPSGTNELAFKSGTGSWFLTGGITKHIYFKTNKQTYTPPAPILTSITISPATATVNVVQTQQFTAVCKDQNNNLMTCPTLTWQSSDTAKATINSSGLLTGITAGTTNVTATSGTVTSNISTVTITTPTPVLTTIEITPPSITLSPGSIQTFIATCKDQFGNTMTCPTITWSSDNTGIGTITQGGAFTAVSGGTTTVRATIGSVVGTSSVTVTTVAPVLTSITISPSTASIAPSYTKILTATPKDQFGNVMTGITIIWSSDNTIIGTISPITGLTTTFTGVSTGSTTIRATSGAVIGTAIMTVTTAPAAGAGGTLLIAGVVALGLAYYMMSRST